MKTAYVNIIVNTDLMADKNYAYELEQRAKALVVENKKKAELAYKMIIERITNGRII